MKNFFKSIFSLSSISIFNFIFLLLFILITSSLEIFGIGLAGYFISSVLTESANNDLIDFIFSFQIFKNYSQNYIEILGISILLIFSLKSFVSYKFQKLIIFFTQNESAILKNKISKLYLNSNYSFSSNLKTSEIINSVMHQTNNFCSNVLAKLISAISDIIILVFLFLFLLIFNFKITLIILLITVAFSLLTIFYFKKNFIYMA